jgi:hypothetical protein
MIRTRCALFIFISFFTIFPVIRAHSKSTTHTLSGAQKVDWRDYRLGDLVKGYFVRGSIGSGAQCREKIEKHYYSFFPNSIGSDYLRRTVFFNDFNQLSKIVVERSNVTHEVPLNNSLVIHLRLGDVAEKYEDSYWEAVSLPGKTYMKNRAYFESVILELPRDIRNVELVSGSIRHGNPTTLGLRRSLRYVGLVVKLFESHGFAVSERNSSNVPDDDFVYMARSRWFVYAGYWRSSLILFFFLLLPIIICRIKGGSFSHLVGECVNRLGGRCYGTYERAVVGNWTKTDFENITSPPPFTCF